MSAGDRTSSEAPNPISTPRGLRLATSLGIHDAGRALRDFVTYLPSQVLPALASFLVLPFLTRRLLPTDLGILTIDQTLIVFGAILLGSWLTAAIVREMPASQASDDVAGLRKTLAAAIGLSALGLVGYSICLAVLGVFSRAVGDNLLLIILGTGGFLVQAMASSLFMARLIPRGYAVVELSARLGGTVLGVALLYDGQGIRGYLLGIGLVPLVVGMIGLGVVWPRAGKASIEPGERDLRRWVHYGVPVALGSVTFLALANIDRYILAGLRDTAATGIYSVGYSLGDRAVSVPTFAFITATGPLLITAYEQHGRPELERLMRSYTRIVLLIGLPIIALMAAIARDLVAIIAGAKDSFYAPASAVIPIVAIGSTLTAFGPLAGAGLGTARRTRLLVLGSASGLVVNVAANLLLIPPFGITGAAIATPIGAFVYLAVTVACGRRFARWSFPTPTLIRTSIASAIAFGVASEVTHDGLSNDLSVVVALVAGSLAYLLVLLVLGERHMR